MLYESSINRIDGSDAELFIRPLIMHIYTFGHATVMNSGDAVGHRLIHRHIFNYKVCGVHVVYRMSAGDSVCMKWNCKENEIKQKRNVSFCMSSDRSEPNRVRNAFQGWWWRDAMIFVKGGFVSLLWLFVQTRQRWQLDSPQEIREFFWIQWQNDKTMVVDGLGTLRGSSSIPVCSFEYHSLFDRNRILSW